MLIRQGEERDSSLDRRLAFTLASVAGAINAAAFHAVGFFSANMTGNVSAVSNLLALGQWAYGLGYLVIVLAFIGGAMASTLVISAGLRRGIAGIYARVVMAEAVLLMLLSAGRMIIDDAAGIPTLIVGLSFLMGLQNAIVTRISDARIRTTHVSGMSTDIGIELADLVNAMRGTTDTGQTAPLVSRLLLHVGTVLCFLMGGIAGVATYVVISDATFALAAVPLLMVALPSLARSRRQQSPAPTMPRNLL
jgi:uncharacterized membrane protein YoaK (UPF0700 family)